MAKRNLVGWTYHDNRGNLYVRRADVIFTAQAAKIGGESAAAGGATDPFPRNYRPRAVRVYDSANGIGAWVVCYTQAAMDALVVNTDTIDFRDAGGTTHTGLVKATRPERLGRMIGD